MAILIPIIKESEDDRTVVYAYVREVWEPDPQRPGRQVHTRDDVGKLGIDKLSGEITRLVDIPGEALGFYLPRVMRNLREAVAGQSFADRLDYRA